ncbi:cation:proton antiporter [Sphingomonas sp. 37zxx]|uniref:cation:proton antiporter n=1 Tax=Sphingomonas sp. 37zxx TaxID=1550073 RepID=UPI000ABEEF5E|nr:cation:proton antiporter family protein [Sphingomonas sp. 37zxx]
MLAAAIGFIGMLLRQPLIVSFIAVGILAGPSGLDIAQSSEPIELLAELGVAILLFLVGIKLDLKLVRTLGAVSAATGLGQVLFTSVFGYLICLALGLDSRTSIYVAVALTFSSTIIIVKLLSDKREIDSLHGRIALGFLIVQDLVVVLAMIVLSAIGIGAREGSGGSEVFSVLAAGLLMLGVVLGFIRYVADPLTARLARSPELLISFAIALAAAFAAIGDAVGFGKELGGLLAGVALASTPFRDAIAARLAPLRDFLLLFFFIALGASLDLANLGRSGGEAAVLSLFVLIGNPLIVVAIMAALGYKRRTGFLAGLTVAQISEFSLIFMAMGVSLGHVSTEALGLVTLVGLITIAASTYMITYSHQLYAMFEPLLRPFDRLAIRRTAAAEDAGTDTEAHDTIVFGLGRYGGTIGRLLIAEGRRVLGVDFSPEAVRRWHRDDLPAVYGDASDPEFLTGLPLRSVDMVVLAIPDAEGGVNAHDTRTVLIQALKEAGFEGRVAVSTQRGGRRDELVAAGADIVLEPFRDAADRAVELLLSPHVAAPSPSEIEDQRTF